MLLRTICVYESEIQADRRKARSFFNLRKPKTEEAPLLAGMARPNTIMVNYSDSVRSDKDTSSFIPRKTQMRVELAVSFSVAEVYSHAQFFSRHHERFPKEELRSTSTVKKGISRFVWKPLIGCVACNILLLDEPV
mmetsp:Transcript_18310/g.73406  ORF Transcript_18310/g.73406 Transcript_18310/m.73406 type:complete len:136 (+) Transcript_18310:2517-2924(+)